MNPTPLNPYTLMQRRQYDAEAWQWTPQSRDWVVGSFDAHNAWEDYEHLFDHLGDTSGMRALDFGCGPGRSLVRYWTRFRRIDGADLSLTNLKNARTWLIQNGCDATATTLWLSNGVDLGLIPSGTYDVVLSTITMQHICVHAIRQRLWEEMARVLKPGGHLSVQMGAGDAPCSVAYEADFWEAPGTNRQMDTRVDEPQALVDDLELAGFGSIRWQLRPTGPGDSHAQWIFVYGRKHG